jgi:outer membrane protein TolC
MKRIAFLLGSFIIQCIAYAQSDTITLNDCYKQLEKTYPLARQDGMLVKSNELKIQNLNKNFLPQLNLNCSASLQSDVTELKVNLPAQFSFIKFPEISKDMYKLSVDVNQSIYDGNVTNYQKKLENFNLQSDQENIKVELYQLKDQVNQVYFSIFLLQQNEYLLNSSKDQLVSKLKEIRSAITNGVMLASNGDAIEAELIKIDQQLIEDRTDRTTAYKVLSELTSTTIPETAKLVLPDLHLSSMAFEDKRPELQLYSIMQSKTGVMKDMVNTRWNPKFYAFGQAGYGRPGLNMLSNDFAPWWMIGAKLTWNIWNWNLSRNEKKIYDIQSEIIGTQKETFEKNIRIEADRGLAEIEKLGELLLKDDDLITLRTRITKTASSQLTNGVITSSDYIARLNEEVQAKLALELHRIQLVKAKISYLFTLGKL